ncbi:MAG: hypothetical protein L0Y72_16360 [Gemmataceae bacterium]|nr:hypothetical protein [Gemmataceae bacterium]MCI0740622.1 hypothetical protein [Gemmataceae bacterium]
MARKTDGEKIDELEKLVAMIIERLDNVRGEMAHRVPLAVVEERVNELKRSIEETSRRQSALVPPIVGAVVGATVSAIVTFLLVRL